jgi:small neutral amino acid transporter SnatA (MarC family)
MLKTALSAFATFFATIGPVEAALLFTTFCPRFSRAERIAISLKATGLQRGSFSSSYCSGQQVSPRSASQSRLCRLRAAHPSYYCARYAQKVVMHVFGILLSAIAVQSVFNGISGSGIFVRSF